MNNGLDGLEHGGLENLLAAVTSSSFLSLLASHLALIITHSRIKLGMFLEIFFFLGLTMTPSHEHRLLCVCEEEYTVPCSFLTHLSLVDMEAVDKSSICLFLETHLELEEPPSTNVDETADIKLIMDDCLRVRRNDATKGTDMERGDQGLSLLLVVLGFSI
eukprot:scaffold55228_cov62-Attheya_sp.AAC.10